LARRIESSGRSSGDFQPLGGARCASGARGINFLRPERVSYHLDIAKGIRALWQCVYSRFLYTARPSHFPRLLHLRALTPGRHLVHTRQTFRFCLGRLRSRLILRRKLSSCYQPAPASISRPYLGLVCRGAVLLPLAMVILVFSKRPSPFDS